MNAVEVLRNDIVAYEALKKSGKRCLTTNDEEMVICHYPEIKEACLALERLDRLEKWLDRRMIDSKRSNKEVPAYITEYEVLEEVREVLSK